MAPVVSLAAPSTLDAHNTFLRDHPLNAANNSSSNNSNNINNNIKQQQVPCQNGEIKQVQQQHSEQEGLSSTAAVAPEQIVVDERENKDLNDSLFSGRGGTRASLGITTTNHEFNGRRTVRWSDTHGVDLVQIWEFQPSDSSDSDDDGEDDSQACACVIV